MKKHCKTLVFGASLVFLLASCGNSSSAPVTPIPVDPTSSSSSSSSASSSSSSSSSSYVPPVCPVDEMQEGDGYLDVLPSGVGEGHILHCFDWSYAEIEEHLQDIVDAGFHYVQTSPVQQPKSGGVSWMYLYQPVSFAIAKSSPLGSKEELASLCHKAGEMGVDVIVDIVANHMATTGKEDEEGFVVVDPEVNEYEPEIYQHRDTYFHRIKNPVGSGSVTMTYPGLPDLNTGDSYIQERVLSLLEECIDVGVDGFRFDAAKHIETSKDPDYPSAFWENTLLEAKDYYREKNGRELLAYGEILNGVDGGRDISTYAEMMKVTDNGYIGSFENAILASKHDASLPVKAPFGKNLPAESLVNWAESHDTYVTHKSHIDETRLAREWAILATRKNVQSLFLARPNAALTVGLAGSMECFDECFGAVNRFANRFIDAEENRFAVADHYYVQERYDEDDAGAIIVSLALEGNVTVPFQNLPDGYYFDQIQNTQVHVVNGKGCVSFGKEGVAVLTKTNNPIRPTIVANKEAGYYLENFDFRFNARNAQWATYSVNGEEPVSFSKAVTLRIGEGVEAGEITSIEIKAGSGNYTKTQIFRFTKVQLIEGGFNVLNFKPEYLDDYDIRFWAWGENSGGAYYDAYEYDAPSHTLLVTDIGNCTSFLVALFPKGTAPEKGYATWVTPKKQSADIALSDGFYDASRL